MLAAVVGVVALVFGVVSFYEAARTPAPKQSVGKHLKSSNVPSMIDEDGSMDVSATLQGLSVLIWGLVVTKANQGISASKTTDATEVKGFFKKGASLICMIVAAYAFKFGSDYTSTLNASVEVEKTTSKHSLKSSNNVDSGDHADSFYDKTSSHYKGGIHNAAFEDLARQVSPTKKHNNRGKIDISDRKKPATGDSLLSQLGDSYKSQKSATPKAKKWEAAGIASFVLIGAISVGYLLAFKSYSASVEKQEKLTALFHNPNARVAAGDQGKSLLKKLGVA